MVDGESVSGTYRCWRSCVVLFWLLLRVCCVVVCVCSVVFYFSVQFLFFVSIHLSSRCVLERFSGLFALSQNLSRSLHVFISFFLPVLSSISFSLMSVCDFSPLSLSFKQSSQLSPSSSLSFLALLFSWVHRSSALVHEVLCACCFAGGNKPSNTICNERHIFPAIFFHSAARRMAPYFRTRDAEVVVSSHVLWLLKKLSGSRILTTSCFAPGAEIFEGIGRAQATGAGQGADSVGSSQPSADNSSAMTSLPFVTVREAELWNIAKTKKCHLPGVHFDRQERRWVVRWQEGGKQRFLSFSICKFEKQGLTEDAASLAALRSSIGARNEKVLPTCVCHDDCFVRVDVIWSRSLHVCATFGMLMRASGSCEVRAKCQCRQREFDECNM